MTLKVKKKRELKRWTDKSHKQQMDNLPDGDVIKDLERRVRNLERKVDEQQKVIQELLAHSREAWKVYGEVQRRESLLAPDGGEEGF